MKSEEIILTLLVEKIASEPIRNNFFLYSKSENMKKEETILLVHDDEYDAPDEIDKYTCRMSWKTMRGIIDNLQSQNLTSTLDDYIEAINYYIENDAFIDKENPYNKPQGGYKIWGMAGTSDKTDI